MPNAGFKIRIPEDQFAKLIPELERGYHPVDDEEVVTISKRATARAYLFRDEFLAVVRWKSPRVLPRAERNSETDVQEATSLALSRETSERLRVGALTLLDGVGYPVASVILHLCHKDVYPILDYRALWTLGWDEPPNYTLGFWLAYTEYVRGLCDRLGCGQRTLDRSLWQYSKEHQQS